LDVLLEKIISIQYFYKIHQFFWSIKSKYQKNFKLSPTMDYNNCCLLGTKSVKFPLIFDIFLIQAFCIYSTFITKEIFKCVPFCQFNNPRSFENPCSLVLKPAKANLKTIIVNCQYTFRFLLKGLLLYFCL